MIKLYGLNMCVSLHVCQPLHVFFFKTDGMWGVRDRREVSEGPQTHEPRTGGGGACCHGRPTRLHAAPAPGRQGASLYLGSIGAWYSAQRQTAGRTRMVRCVPAARGRWCLLKMRAGRRAWPPLPTLGAVSALVRFLR